MQRFCWLGYETQLLEQLQRQQNSTQFCDTMLQSDGISVPAHSCVLAALSPYLSQRLSASPSPRSGQKRWLHLQAVSAQTLVKLVRLLYSGELEVRSREEQNEVLAAAHKFGITNIKLGCKDSEGEGTELLGVRQKVHMRGMHKGVKMQDPKVPAEISGKIEDDPVERKSFASIGTQTVESILMSALDPGPAPALPPTVESASVVGSCSTCQSKNVFQSSLTSNPSVHSDPQVSAQRGSASFRHMETIATCLSQHADSPRSQKKNQPAEEDQERPGQQDGNRKATVDGGEKTLKKEQKKKKSHFITGGKNLEKMKWKRESMETAKISIKVKLRRRTRGDVWETVGVQDEDVSVLSNLNQNTPQTGLDVLQTPGPSALPVQYPDSQKVRDVSNSSPEQANTSSFSEARSTGSLWMDHSSELEPECLLPPQSPGEESNEQIDEMLESIMRSLNYLPNLNTNCKKSQVDLGAASTFHEVPATENDVGPTVQSADVAAAEGVSYQTLETPGDQSDTDTGIHHFAAQNQPILAVPSPVPTDLQTWQQQLPQMSSSVLLSGPVKSPFPQTSGFPLPVTCFSIGENLDRLLLQQPSFHEDQSVQALPPLVATEFPPPCTDELRLPRCLSPLKPSPCESPSGNALPWLKGSACTLQLPLNNIAARDDARQSGDRESERIKMRKTDEHDAVEDAPPPKKRKARCPNSQKGPKVPALDQIASRGRNAAKSLHSVCLYCPAVPMKERETNSSLSPGSATLVTAPRGAKSRGAPNLGAENARIKTRSFVKTCEQNSSSTVTDRCCVLIPLISRAVMVPKQDPPPKRGRGRPRKIKLEKKTTDAAGAEIRVQKEAREKASEKQTTTEERKTCRRLISTVGNRDAEQQRKSDKCPGKTETDNVGSSQTLKPSLMKTLKELRKCIQWKPSKTRKGKEAPGGKGSKAVDLEKAKVSEAEDGSNMRAEMEKDGEAKFQHQTLYDNNHNLLPNTSKDECKPAGTDGLETWRSRATLPGNRDQSARSSHQGDYGSSTLSCFDEEENEEDEVDVLLYSPEKGSPTREVEERVLVLPDEDEEEDGIEIDVTGDEE